MSWSWTPSRFENVAKRDGIPKTFHCGNAVLPFGTRGTAQKINRARLCNEITPMPATDCFQPQPEGARRKKRDANDIAEYPAIFMPPYGSPRGVFGDENLLKVSGPDTSEFFRPRAKAGEEFRNIFSFGQPAAVKIIAPAEGPDPALSGKAVKLKLAERQGLDTLQKELLLLSVEKIRLEPETLRKRVVFEKIKRLAICDRRITVFRLRRCFCNPEGQSWKWERHTSCHGGCNVCLSVRSGCE